jgi:transposase
VCDESYFGGRRGGSRGRGAAGKVPVFGLLKRNGKVYTRIVENVSRETLRQIILTKVVPESVIDSFRSYDGLVLNGFKYYRINIYFYLKEMELRFNHRMTENIATLIKKIAHKCDPALISTSH